MPNSRPRLTTVLCCLVSNNPILNIRWLVLQVWSNRFFFLRVADQPDGHFKGNGGSDGSIPVVDTPSMNQYGVTHSYAPIPIDVSHFDLGALGWDNDGFLSTLGNSLADGFQETDLFC